MKPFFYVKTGGGALNIAKETPKRRKQCVARLPLLLIVAVFSLFTNAALANEVTISTNSSSSVWSGGTDGYSANYGTDGNSGNSFIISYTKGSSNNAIAPKDDHLRIYKGATLTIASTIGSITKIAITTTSTNYPATALSTTVGQYSSGTWTGTADSVVFTATAQVRPSKIVITYTPSGEATACSAPTFNPVDKTTFIEGNELSVELSCATEDATIYYTTDGTDPTENSTKYESAITISATTTVKAIAVDSTNTLASSSVAEATYTMLTPVEGIKGLRTQIESDNNSAATTYAVNLTNAVVTFVPSTSKCYIEQDGVGIMFYKSSHGFSAGDTFNGTATVTACMYNSMAEVTSIDLEPTSDTAPAPTVVTVKDIQDDFFSYGLRYVKVVNATVGETAITSSNRNGEITDESSSTALTLRSGSTDLTADANVTVNVTGVCELYSGSAQLVFYSIETVSTEKKFEFSAETATATINEAFTEPELTNDYETTVTYSSSNESVATVDASTGDVSLVTAGETTITATDGTNSASYTLTVSEATTPSEYADSITIDSFGGGSSSYADYTQYTSSTTGVVYDGNGANSYSCIQLRSRNSNSGVIAYSDTRTLVSVEVSWNAATTDGRTLDVYGNTTAYSSPADLYSTDSQGTKLGSIVCGTSTSLVLTSEQLGQYNAVGLCSNNSAMYLEYIIFTWSDGSTTIERFVFSATTATATVGEDFTEPTLTNTYGTTATYTSSNTDVATVDAATGEIVLIAAGETTITATDGTNSASYALTVKAAVTLTGDGSFENPYTVADVKALHDAGTTISEQVWVVGTIVGSAKSATALNDSGSDVNYNIALAADAASTDFIPVKLPTALRSIANVKDNADNVGKEVKVYGTLDEYFSTAGMTPTAKIYGLTTIDIKTAEGYATYYNASCAYEMPEGLQGGLITDASSQGGTLTIEYKYNASDVVPAGSALLLYNNGDGVKSYGVVNTSSGASAESGGLLYGAAANKDDSGNTYVADGYYYYKLTYDESNSNLGFYWGADNGAGFAMTNPTGAFLAISTATSAAKGFVLSTEDGGTTGISTVSSTATVNANDAVFTLSGVRINANKGNMPKGLYIINGKKVLVK